MPITALCPFCRSGYQVQATLRGQLVRCPNAACRKVFAVPVEEAAPQTAAASLPPSSPLPGNSQRSGSVGDLVPMLPVEQAAPPASSSPTSKHVSEMLPLEPSEPAASATGGRPAEGDWWQAVPPVRGTPGQPAARPPAAPSSPPPSPTPAATWWRDAPPPLRAPQTPAASPPPSEPAQRPPPARPSQRSAEPTQPMRPIASPLAETQRMPVLPPETPDQPRELPPGVWEPPPVRRGGDASDKITQTVTETAAPTHRPRMSKRLAWLAIAGFSLLTFGVLGGGVVWVWLKLHRSEEARFAEALDYYRHDSFGKAESEFSELAQKFPNSARREEYRFLADWSAVCRDVSNPDADLPATIVRLDQLVKDHKEDLRTSQCGHDAGQQLLKLAKVFVARNADPPDDRPLKDAERIEQLRQTVAALGPDALTKEEAALIDADLGKVRQAVEKTRKRRDVLAAMQKGNKETPMDAIKRVRDLLARSERELPGITQDDKARQALQRLYEMHRTSVVYQPRQEDAPPPRARPDDNAKTLLFASLLPTAAPGKAPEKEPIVLALVRGVLYALSQSNGELKWAIRVGIDTTALPQRVPASQVSPELLLVLSADTQTLLALDTEGNLQWEYPVGQRVLGRPIIIDHRAYLAAYDGWIHEIELSGGQLLGRWYLGQRLTRGGAREGDSSRIYFPADDSCLYVLDVSPQQRCCVAILEDGHRSGSLRSGPVIIPPEGDNAPGYLILNEASGLDAMRLRVFELPLQDRHAAPLPLKPPARLAGWTWFAPYQDGEKLAVLSDAGILGLFGIRQLGNRDQALFPMLQPGGLDLSPFLQGEGGRELPRERSRAQVVHMQGNDLWVLARGRLQQMRLGFKDAKGLQATPGWKEPLSLGSPLHEPQPIPDHNGRSTFVVVTQALEQQICLATAVDEEGHILWQRQLGLVCQGEPLVLTPPGGGPPLLLALDQGGGLFTLDPLRPNKPRALAAALDENPRMPPRLLPAPDGHTAYEVAAPGDGRKLLVRRIEWVNGAREPRVKERASSLETDDKVVLMPAGAPAVVGAQLIVPITDGNLRRLSLREDEPDLEGGPTWRGRLAPVTAPCHVLALSDDRFLLTDGSRGLLVYDWPLAKNFQPLSERPLPYLVAAPPVLLPSRDGQPPRVAVADSAGVLHLFVVKPDGSLHAGLTWELNGKLTSGPFVHAAPDGGPRLGCVLDHHRLVWIDPAKEKTLWTYSSGSAALVGQPRRIEDLLVVTLQSGHYVGLDPNTGRPKGSGYPLRTSAAPAAAPMPFGPGRMFTPLSDGTALLLSVARLREPAKK